MRQMYGMSTPLHLLDIFRIKHDCTCIRCPLLDQFLQPHVVIDSIDPAPSVSSHDNQNHKLSWSSSCTPVIPKKFSRSGGCEFWESVLHAGKVSIGLQYATFLSVRMTITIIILGRAVISPLTFLNMCVVDCVNAVSRKKGYQWIFKLVRVEMTRVRSGTAEMDFSSRLVFAAA